MPNTYRLVWLDQSQHSALKQLSAARGAPMTALLRDFLHHAFADQKEATPLAPPRSPGRVLWTGARPVRVGLGAEDWEQICYFSEHWGTSVSGVIRSLIDSNWIDFTLEPEPDEDEEALRRLAVERKQ